MKMPPFLNLVKSDDEKPINLALFNPDQLQRHAKALAVRHVVDKKVGGNSLLLRLQSNEKVLAKSYERLNYAVQNKQQISPAGEWILDNFYVIEEQIATARRHFPKGYSRALPHLINTQSFGNPRVYDIALEVIAHVDGRVDNENITNFLRAYQNVTCLKIGEFWAIPIMLRLALIENLRRVAQRVLVAMEERDLARHLAKTMLEAAEISPNQIILVTADMARSLPVLSNAFIAEFIHILQGQGKLFDIPLTWIEHQLEDEGRSTLESVQIEGQQQATNQVSVSASISSLRFLDAMDWPAFIESLSEMELELGKDPSDFYCKMDFKTRDTYRHVVEDLAKRSGQSELDVASSAIRLAQNYLNSGKSIKDQERHVGYYLVGIGIAELKKAIGYKPWKVFVSETTSNARTVAYIASISILTILLNLVIFLFVDQGQQSPFAIWALVFLTLLSGSQVAMAIVNWIVTASMSPTNFPKLDFSEGVPAEYRTLVVVPTLLVSENDVASLLEDLEVRYLANRDKNINFALLTDFADSAVEHLKKDKYLCEKMATGISALNAKYATVKRDIFFLFHRPRVWSSKQNNWMGYERKRGKLSALNDLLRAEPADVAVARQAFSLIVGNLDHLSAVKYVITLDTDTQLPRDAARKLIGAMAHPLNRAFYDDILGRVTKGYGILQPRVAVSLPGARRSLYVRLFNSDPGIDPYTNAVSDVYQDLFHEGSFIGKGIYDIDAFQKSLNMRLPNDLILSHDLLEGCYARCGLVTDVLFYEEHPHHYSEDTKRRKRWIRGDWQIIYWLFPLVPTSTKIWSKNTLTLLSKWKIFDNLRRSMVSSASLGILTIAWIFGFDPLVLTGIVIALIFAPLFLTSLTLALRTPRGPNLLSVFENILIVFARQVGQLTLCLVFLPYDAYISLAGIGRSMLRMFVTGRGLLEWNAASGLRHSHGHSVTYFYGVMAASPVIGLLFCGMILFSISSFNFDKLLLFQILLLSLWILSPAIAWWISRPLNEEGNTLSNVQSKFLRQLSRKTWRFFETFVGPDENWLPPDNFQEFPVATIAHRTSPTNIGLSLIANMTAFDFGYISAQEVVHRVSQALSTMDKMEKFRGHFFNWYDTSTLEPLNPRYISTVDSGNLAGFLFTLKPGLRELVDSKIIPVQVFHGLSDCLEIVLKLLGTDAACQRLLQCFENPPHTLSGVQRFLTTISMDVSVLREKCLNCENEEIVWWIEAFISQLNTTLYRPLETYAPWLRFLPLVSEQFDDLRDIFDDLDRMATFQSISNLAQKLLPLIQEPSKAETHKIEWLIELQQAVSHASFNANELIIGIDTAIEQCHEHALFEFDFLYDKSRRLLSIGYNATQHRRDTGFYDLLASEARLCSFIGIALGRLPQEHWFALGRLVTATKGDPTLLSWSGSMFEYLMPLLVMPTFPNTLLDISYKTAVARQIAYGKKRGVPWGVSESGYNATDSNLNYQYRAFGVPGLGFKRGLADDLVIAPYASVMALMIAPSAAYFNLINMSNLGYEGKFGFYESIDFTSARLGTGEKQTIIKSFMAHHQGMSLLSLGYLLLNQKMQRRFHSDPRLQGTELLLHERIPKISTYHPKEDEAKSIPRFVDDLVSNLRVINTPHTLRPEVHLLSNGRYSVMITNSGGGYSRWHGLAISRWREDPTCDNWGSYCYIRDAQSGEFWSSGHQPTLKAADHYEAIFTQARAEFRRRDGDFESHTEITVSPEDDVELRRFSITNRSNRTRIIEVTTYSEVVLTSQGADEAHVAFSNLFVQTEILASKQALICTRRPRSEHEKTPTLVHLMSVHGDCYGEMSYETDRSKFIGRGGSKVEPAAMINSNYAKSLESLSKHLSGTSGSVLDPIVSIRCCIVIEPEQTARVHVVTGVGKDRLEALELIEKYHDKHLASRVFDLAWAHRQIVLRQLSITENEAQLYSRLASSVVYANPSRRGSSSVIGKNIRGQSGLWGYGISGDCPIVLLKTASSEKIMVVQQLLRAHNYSRLMGLSFELIILIGDDASYRQDFQEDILILISTVSEASLIDKSGGIFVRRAEQMSIEDRILLDTVARAVFVDSKGSLADQIDRFVRPPVPIVQLVPVRKTHLISNSVQETKSSIVEKIFPNTFGDFSNNGKEYVIQQTGQKLTPAPWSNVIANPYFGSVVSESGASYTWCENAHSFRLTPWYNDPIEDSCGEGFYIRDEETGSFWSPSALPVRGKSCYETSHGFGYSVFRHETDDILSDLTMFVAIDAPVKIYILKIRNGSERARIISVTNYCEWVLGESRARSLMHVVTEVDLPTGAFFARNRYHHEFGERIGFLQVSETSRTVTGDRSEFLGRNGRMSSPAAMSAAQLSGKVGAGLDACGAMQVSIKISPGEDHEIVFLLGVGRDVNDARILMKRFGDVHSAHLALESVHAYWDKTLGAVQLDTPDVGLNNLGNGWLIYQIMASRLWARSGYYQSSGAFGFRDQLQDTMALIHTEPRLLREHILRAAARQFKDGDVQHWWHPPSGRGVRTHFSDDFLWLPLTTTRYVLGIGDTGILEEPVNFIEGRPIKRDEEAYSDLPRRSEETSTLYDHCVRAIKYGLKFGHNGLPLIGCGDWNDGMNLVGTQGRGESVWLAFFMYDVLMKFSKVAQIHKDAVFSTFCVEEAKKIQQNIEQSSWDGDWYRRAYFDDGTPLGSAANSECQIDSLPQSWAVLSGAGEPERSRKAMESVDLRLVDRENKIIKLFTPPFDKGETDPGYIKGYVPGVRENGGQYTHAAIWSAMAFAALGNQERVWEYFSLISPINHTKTSSDVLIYKVEPYVIAADVYAVEPHIGRGGWTWYTGAAGWTYRLILESILGISLDIDHLTFRPCVPSEWKEFSVRYRYRDTHYHIKFKSALNGSFDKGLISLDGKILEGVSTLHLRDDLVEHTVEVFY